MGMYDNVDFMMDCPGCGKKVDGFQTKDGDCQMELVPVTGLYNFYSSCNNCGLWIEFDLKPGVSIEDFEMTTVEKPEPGKRPFDIMKKISEEEAEKIEEALKSKEFQCYNLENPVWRRWKADE